MMNQWKHPHTLATGLVAGLALTHDSLLLAALSFAAGAGVVLGWNYLLRVGRWTRGIIEGVAHRG